MRNRYRIAILACSLSVPLSFAGAAGAQAGKGGGSVDPDGTVEVGISVSTPGFDAPVDLAGGTSTQPVIWTVVDVGPVRPGDLSGLCAVEGADGEGPGFGWLYRFLGRTHDGTLVADRLVCIPFAEPGVQPPPPLPPRLPTIEEIWRRAQLPTPRVGLDPATRGITGLDTRIWTETPTSLGITAALDGYSITGTATVTGYTVQVDDGPTRPAATSGTAGDPIAHHVFETKGEHQVRIGVVWHGTATFTGPGLLGPLTINIGDATVTAARAYRVNEIRSVLQP
jgi:hypothetical protein